VLGCVDCHTRDLGGKRFIDSEAGRLAASNLTHGAGGVGDVYADVDWVRAIRHGVRPTGKPLLVMPSAELLIDHTAPVVAQPPSVSVEYGQYLVASCTGCHQANFAGGPLPGQTEDSPPAANLTPAGRLSRWTEADFIQTIRSGVRADGTPINNAKYALASLRPVQG